MAVWLAIIARSSMGSFSWQRDDSILSACVNQLWYIGQTGMSAKCNESLDCSRRDVLLHWDLEASLLRAELVTPISCVIRIFQVHTVGAGQRRDQSLGRSLRRQAWLN